MSTDTPPVSAYPLDVDPPSDIELPKEEEALVVPPLPLPPPLPKVKVPQTILARAKELVDTGRHYRPPFVNFHPGMMPTRGDVVLLSSGPPGTEHLSVFLTELKDEKGTYWELADDVTSEKGNVYSLIHRTMNLRTVVGWFPASVFDLK